MSQEICPHRTALIPGIPSRPESLPRRAKRQRWPARTAAVAGTPPDCSLPLVSAPEPDRPQVGLVTLRNVLLRLRHRQAAPTWSPPSSASMTRAAAPCTARKMSVERSVPRSTGINPSCLKTTVWTPVIPGPTGYLLPYHAGRGLAFLNLMSTILN